jgi:ADP-ribosyl-[dinitrogen reductase] hydrolase
MRNLTIDRDRAKGALVGLAVGDAVGTTLEFRAPGTFPPITDMVGGGPFGLPVGAWTDDTSMALCLAESLIETRTFDLADQLTRFVRWRTSGHLSSTGRCFDIGGATAAALSRFSQFGTTVNNAGNERSAANGSLMRLAPVAIRYSSAFDECVSFCGESSRSTHALPICVDACRLLGAILFTGMATGDKARMLAPDLLADLDPKIAAIAAGSYKEKQPLAIRGSGYVVESLEAALWAFSSTASFRDCILAAANLGDDADTTAAIAGQIAGSCYGQSDIPPEWLERLILAPTIAEFAERLAAMNEERTCRMRPASGGATPFPAAINATR